MKKLLYILFLCFLFGVLIIACNALPSIQNDDSSIQPIIEVTRIVPQTVIVTQLVEITEPPKNVPTVDFKNDTAKIPDLDINPAYWNGVTVITQYYTFLGHSLYEEAYNLLSSAAQQPHSLDEYVEAATVFFKDVEIHSIYPFEFSTPRTREKAFQNMDKEIWFVAEITAWGEGEFSGSIPSGQPQTLYLLLVRENDEWKIDTFATAIVY